MRSIGWRGTLSGPKTWRALQFERMVELVKEMVDALRVDIIESTPIPPPPPTTAADRITAKTRTALITSLAAQGIKSHDERMSWASSFAIHVGSFNDLSEPEGQMLVEHAKKEGRAVSPCPACNYPADSGHAKGCPEEELRV